MKLTIQKILICALSLIVSIAACVCGMYMTILAHMQMGYRILFCLFFILNPVLTIFMIRFMFKKPVPREGTDGVAESEKKKKWGWSSKKDEPDTAGTEDVPDAENYDVATSATDIPETQSETSAFAGEFNDDIDFADPVTEKSAGSVTEESVANFKKISLRRKKRADE